MNGDRYENCKAMLIEQVFRVPTIPQNDQFSEWKKGVIVLFYLPIYTIVVIFPCRYYIKRTIRANSCSTSAIALKKVTSNV